MRTTLPAAALLASACVARAQLLYSEVPYAFSADRQVFVDLFARARTQPVRLLVLGDSQETTPGGGGVVYLPRLNFELWLRYGATPETPFLPAGGSTGAGPPADWLGRVTHTFPGAQYSPLPLGWLPPTFNSNSYGSSGYAALLSLEHDATYCDPGLQCVGAFSFLNTSGGAYIDVLTATSTTGGDVAYRLHDDPTGQPSYWTPVFASGTFGLNTSAAQPAAIVGTVGPFPFTGYLHAELGGVSDTNRATILGARFRSAAAARGITVSSFSAGGYLSGSFLNNHGNCGQVLSALGFDAVMLAYGANDAFSGVSPAQFAANEQAIITALRSWISPDLPVILMGDPFRYGLSASFQAQYDRYPGAQLALAETLPRVMVVNGRRRLEDWGWNAAGAAAFLADEVHYNALGGRMKAAAEASILEGYAIFPCYADADRSGTLNINDFVTFLNRYAAGDAYANCDRSSTAPLLNVNDFGCFINKFAAGCAP